MNVKKKILFVNSSISGGGAGKALIYLLQAIDKNRIEPVVILPSDGVIGEKILEMNIRVIYIPWLPERFGRTQFQLPYPFHQKWIQKLFNVLLMPFFGFRLAGIAKRENADAICSNHQYHVPICTFAGFLSGKPVIMYLREYLEGFWSKIGFRAMAKTSSIKKIFSVSRKSAEPFSDFSKLEVLYDCYDFETFGQTSTNPILRSMYKISSDTFVVGFIGRIIERKGVDLLIKAFENVLHRYPNSYLVIVGGNDSSLTIDLIETYKKLSVKLGIEKHVTFTGFQSDVRPMIRDFNLSVMPSLNPEPFGLVHLEAIIHKIPSLVPSNSGAAEVVENGKDGFIFEAKNIQSLSNMICEIIVLKKNMPDIVSGAFQRAKKKFDVHERSKQVTEAFLSVLNS